jgi:lactococcin 972 family bacteriocin
MKIRTIIKTSLTAAVATTMLSAGAALATVAHPEGGTWDYGVTSSVAYSNYHHATKHHGSTAQNGNGTVRSPNVTPGSWSNAQIKKATGGNKAFYRLI